MFVNLSQLELSTQDYKRQVAPRALIFISWLDAIGGIAAKGAPVPCLHPSTIPTPGFMSEASSYTSYHMTRQPRSWECLRRSFASVRLWAPFVGQLWLTLAAKNVRDTGSYLSRYYIQSDTRRNAASSRGHLLSYLALKTSSVQITLHHESQLNHHIQPRPFSIENILCTPPRSGMQPAARLVRLGQIEFEVVQQASMKNRTCVVRRNLWWPQESLIDIQGTIWSRAQKVACLFLCFFFSSLVSILCVIDVALFHYYLLTSVLIYLIHILWDWSMISSY